MPTVYPTVVGAWSTRTWNNDATGAAYGMPPQPGDTVLANGLAITVDVDISVVAISTRAGTTAIAGGSFTTSGNDRVINADTYAGTTNCLTLAANSRCIQNGNSYGSDTTNVRYGTTLNATTVQNGNSFGGNGSVRTGTLINSGGVQNGNSTGGSVSGAVGTSITAGGVQNGNSTGGSVSGAFGTNVAAGGLQVGDSYGANVAGANGTECFGIQIGNSFGAASAAGIGTRVQASGIHNGNATGGGVSGAHGTQVFVGGYAFIQTATGTVSGANGVQSTMTTRYVAIIKNEVGSFAKSLTSAAETTSVNVPFVSFESTGGGASARMVNVRGGADQ